MLTIQCSEISNRRNNLPIFHVQCKNCVLMIYVFSRDKVLNWQFHIWLISLCFRRSLSCSHQFNFTKVDPVAENLGGRWGRPAVAKKNQRLNGPWETFPSASSTPQPFTNTNEGLKGFPTKNVIILGPCFTKKAADFAWFLWGFHRVVFVPRFCWWVVYMFKDWYSKHLKLE